MKIEICDICKLPVDLETDQYDSLDDRIAHSACVMDLQQETFEERLQFKGELTK